MVSRCARPSAGEGVGVNELAVDAQHPGNVLRDLPRHVDQDCCDLVELRALAAARFDGGELLQRFDKRRLFLLCQRAYLLVGGRKRVACCEQREYASN